MAIDVSKLKDFLKVSELSKLLNIHPNTLRNWDRNGRLKAVRIGTRKDRRYRKEDILSFFNLDKIPESPEKVLIPRKEISSGDQESKPIGSSLPILKKEEK